MCSLHDLKITQLRDINKQLGLSNRRSKDENVRQIIHHMKNEYLFEGPYNTSTIAKCVAEGKPSSVDIGDTNVHVNQNKLVRDLISKGVVKKSVLGKVNDPLPCIIDTLYLNNLISLQNYARDSDDESSSDEKIVTKRKEYSEEESVSNREEEEYNNDEEEDGGEEEENDEPADDSEQEYDWELVDEWW